MRYRKITDKKFVQNYGKLKESIQELKDMFSQSLVGLHVGIVYFLIALLASLVIVPKFYWKRRRLCKDMGMSVDQINCLYDNIVFLPFLNQLCKMNTNARAAQEPFLKSQFGLDDLIIADYVYEKEYDEDEIRCFNNHSKKMKLNERKAYADNFFKLAILEDGIHNDEWDLLMHILEGMKFNNNYIEYYKRRYGPLRTNCDEDHKNSASTVESSVFLNKYYSILGLDNNATDEEIKRAYHNLALQHHPDLPKNAGRIQECEEMMAKINEAYEKIRG